MPVNVIELPKALRGVIDGFVLANVSVERGGLVFGSPKQFVAFLPVPNVSATPQGKYEMMQGWQQYGAEFERLVGYPVVAHVHTHPNHSIPSEQDHRYHAHHQRDVPYHVLIAPNAGDRKTTWWVLDGNFEVQELQEVDKDLEGAALLLARRFGFVDLGHVLMDSDGTVRAEGAIGHVLVTDVDARQLYTRLRVHGKVQKKGDLVRLSGLARPRAAKALEVLLKAGLVKHDYYGFTVVDLFGRRVGV